MGSEIAPNTLHDEERLKAIARRVCWWQPADQTLDDRPVFLSRVMVFGTWDDVSVALDIEGEDAFRKALVTAPPGLFDPRSWNYWHRRLKVSPIPSLAQRMIPT